MSDQFALPYEAPEPLAFGQMPVEGFEPSVESDFGVTDSSSFKAASQPPSVSLQGEHAESAFEPDMLTVTASLDQLTNELKKHHERASHREAVIDSLQAEGELLRRSERRLLLRPLLAATARLRDELLLQANTLPEDFDAPRATKLLQSFADSVELVLGDHGVRIKTPEIGDDFDARQHRIAGKTETSIAEHANTIAEIRRVGYIDSESGVILSHPAVIVFFHDSSVPDPDSVVAAEEPEERPTVVSAEASFETPAQTTSKQASSAPNLNGELK